MRASRSLVVAIALGLVASPLVGQSAPVFRDSVTIVPGARYARGGLYQFFFGRHYRDLWTTPLRVPVLDLKSFAGGLTPARAGGGQQTKSLRLNGADGRQYAFRSVDKDPSSALPPDLRETFADRVFQDQVSAGHPTGALVVPPILKAAGVLHAPPVLVVMPDDPALGEFRVQFGNVLGLLEERPRDSKDEDLSFAGAKDIVSTEDVLKRLDRNAKVRVDSREFLLARLTDVFLGDWDRHQDQWRWALVEGPRGDHWLPIPRDRDQAFVRFDGFLLNVVRQQIPQLVNFGPEYGPIVGATWNGRDLDRRLLTDLERPVWDSVARVLQGRITDAVIAEAAASLPAEYRRLDGPRLETALRARRDAIPTMAATYYRHLSGQVDIHATGLADVASVLRAEGGEVDVAVRAAGSDAPYYHRRFHPGETKDVRVYLHAGADSAAITGASSSAIKVRVIGDAGNDRFVNADGVGRAKFYDAAGENSSVGGSIDTKPYRAVKDSTNPLELPHRDWGQRKLRFPIAALQPDAGVVLGWGGRFTTWGFRKKPFASLFRYSATVATSAQTGKLVVGARLMNENSRSYFAFEAIASGTEVLRWYGFGNETSAGTGVPPSFFRVTQAQLSFTPTLGWALGDRSLLEVGPTIKYANTAVDDGPNSGRFIGTDRPFGTGGFGQLGGSFSLSHDSRNRPRAATRGMFLEVGGSAYPALLDVEKPFGELHGRVSTFLTARMPTSPTLAIQVGAKKIFGTEGSIPFHEAAFLGSRGTLRGFRSQRFAGDDAAIYGSAELRMHLTNLFIFVPGQQGLFAFYDRGRVFRKGESSDLWHDTIGGGVWFSFLTPNSLISGGVGKSDEGYKVYGGVGFAF